MCACTCVRERVRLTMCAPVCVSMGVRACVRRLRVRALACGLARLWVHAGLRARSACVRVYVCGLSVCAFAGVRASVLFSGILGLLRWYLGDTNGTRRVLKEYLRGTQRVLMLLSSGPQGVPINPRALDGVLEAYSCSWGVLWGT